MKLNLNLSSLYGCRVPTYSIICHRRHPHNPQILITGQVCNEAQDITWNATQPMGRWEDGSTMDKYSDTRAAQWSRHIPASAWFFRCDKHPVNKSRITIAKNANNSPPPPRSVAWPCSATR